MPFNGSGTFSRIYSWVTDAANGVLVRADRMDTDTNDIATALTNCVTRDGQSPATANLPMGGNKLTGLANGSSTTDSAAFGQIATAITQAGPPSVCDFRLSGTTGSPVPFADQTAIGTLYFAPYKGNKIALYDGSANWNIRVSAEFSIAVPAVANTVYDVFCYDNSGVPTLELVAWTNDTSRNVAVTLFSGVYTKTTDTTRRYVGTVRTDGSNKLVDSYAKRWVWNYYNRVRRPMRAVEATASWTYTTATFRQANASTANQVDYVQGFVEDAVTVRVLSGASNTNAGVYSTVGIGMDSTTTPITGSVMSGANCPAANLFFVTTAEVTHYPGGGAGRHFFTWLEYSTATGTTTWNGTSAFFQAGIVGDVLA